MVRKAVKHPCAPIGPCDEVDVGLPDYSLEEQDTGRKWLDGRPIYCKTFQFAMPVAATPFDILHGIADFDRIVGQGVEGTLRRRQDFNQWISLTCSTHPSIVGEQILVSVMPDKIRLEDAGTQWDNEPGEVTIYYVKLPAP